MAFALLIVLLAVMLIAAAMLANAGMAIMVVMIVD